LNSAARGIGPRGGKFLFNAADWLNEFTNGVSQIVPL
jgi:hypothetical protein